MWINRNASAIIFYCNRAVFVNTNNNFFTISCKSLINRVIYNFVNQMVQSIFSCLLQVPQELLCLQPCIFHPPFFRFFSPFQSIFLALFSQKLEQKVLLFYPILSKKRQRAL